ncbi:MAG: 5-(carboxyamino)imidazole ribonucleotide synthase [Alphaproteobacteria bacterium]|nr:MAG: 5-(carboxyamino)imidazole ribonucleotide synthase [Alphaproteobacteria bacterium]
MTAMIAPGATIGILGGGQLGRMTAQAAARLGYRTAILAPEADAPAFDVATYRLQADYRDEAALQHFASAVDVITYEFENVPVETAEFLAQLRPVRPGPKVLKITQDRLREKDFCGRAGCPTTRYRALQHYSQLAAAAADLGLPAVLKATRLGYDGKAQAMLTAPEQFGAGWRVVGDGVGILEAFVDFVAEASVIVARSPSGQVACYPAVENRHADHILHSTHVPGCLTAAHRQEAEAIARRLADAVALEGLLAVELFVTREGPLLVNELAPRPHNSGHWTMDFAATSQFEQLIRAICNLPLGDPSALGPCVMENLLGDQITDWPGILATPGARLHLYGKREVKAGRKMGHVNRPA